MNAPIARLGRLARSSFSARSHPKPRILGQGQRWRLVDEGNQWSLEVKKGKRTRKSTGWRGRKYHVEKAALCCSIRELCGSDRQILESAVAALPDLYGK